MFSRDELVKSLLGSTAVMMTFGNMLKPITPGTNNKPFVKVRGSEINLIRAEAKRARKAAKRLQNPY